MTTDTFITRVKAKHLRKEQVAVQFRMASITCDHPPELNGDDLGPTPSEFLLAALACSICQYVGRNAAKHKIPLESVEVACDFAVGQEPSSGPLGTVAFLSKAEARVEIKGDLTDEQFQLLKYFAEHCPVAETLRRGVPPLERVVLVKAKKKK